MRRLQTVRIAGYGMTRIGKLGQKATNLMHSALESALGNARLRLHDLNGLIAIPSLSHPHFMEAHYLATQMGLLPQKDVLVRTIDTGGAGPVTGLLEAARLIESGQCDCVAVVAGDAVSSLSKEEFLQRADQGCQNPEMSIPSPVIPHGYDRVAQWHMKTYGLTREQLAMCSVLMSRQAVKHPYSLTRKARTLDEVLTSPRIGKVTNLLECARRADGGAAIIVASSAFLQRKGLSKKGAVFLGGGEASGPLYPPPVIDEDMFSCEEAARSAYEQSQLGPGDIDFFGLYDCFPICLIRAVEAVGLAKKGKGGDYIEARYRESENGMDVRRFPINTHGGLLAFGAPWEVPAMYNIIEAVQQLSGEAGDRQIANCRRAVVYGNGGIFSASAVAILGNGEYQTIRSRDQAPKL